MKSWKIPRLYREPASQSAAADFCMKGFLSNEWRETNKAHFGAPSSSDAKVETVPDVCMPLGRGRRKGSSEIGFSSTHIHPTFPLCFAPRWANRAWWYRTKEILFPNYVYHVWVCRGWRSGNGFLRIVRRVFHMYIYCVCRIRTSLECY